VYGEIEKAGPVGFAPAGDWVAPQTFERWTPSVAQTVDGGRRYWLSDSQWNLSGGGHVWYHRVVTEVVAGDGLQSVASISIDFDPSYQSLDIHHLRVLRGDQTRTLDPALLVNVLRRERDLERAMYDGRLTAHLVTPDVRLGDIVDYAYSITGAQPVFGGRFATEVGFQWGCWVGETRERILVDAGRPLVTRRWGEPPDDQVRTLDDGRVEHLWISRDTPAMRNEPDVPGWARTTARLRIADAMTWTQVADVFHAAYAPPEVLPPDLETELAEIEARAPTPAQRVVEGLRLVQSGLRYHSVSLGDGGFVPRPVDRIWATRAGDCKDSSRLLVAVLRRLGVEADPALVNTYAGHGLGRDAPNLIAFDHCITRVVCDGAVYWLDPTRYPQGGALAALTQSRYGWALPLVADAQLEAMGEDAPAEVCDCREVLVLGPVAGGPSTLEVETVYRAWRADDMRRRLANEGPAELQQSYEDHYARAYGRVTVLKPLEVVDDLDANALTIREAYEFERAWEPGQNNKVTFTTQDDVFSPHLTPSRTLDRRFPIDLGLPRTVRSEILIKQRAVPSISSWNDSFEMDGVKATSRLEAAGDKTWKLTRMVTVSRRHLDAAEAPRYFDLREAALRSSGLFLSDTLEPARKTLFNLDRRLVFAAAWVLIFIVLKAVAVFFGR
jgi:transglutaminase-like putative cysteine protease